MKPIIGRKIVGRCGGRVRARLTAVKMPAFLGLLTFATSAPADIEQLYVTDEGLISLQATEVPLEELVVALGDELSIAVTFPSPVTERVSVAFEDLTLEQALKQMTRSYILVTSSETDPPQVREIIVMSEGGESSSYLPKGGNVSQQNRDADAAAGVSAPKSGTSNRTMDQVRKRLEAGIQEENPDEDPETRIQRGLPESVIPPPLRR